MGGIYEDAKSIAARQWPILLDLLRNYLKRNGNRFLLLSETPVGTRLLTTLTLIVIYVALLSFITLLDPLARDVSLFELGRSGARWTLIFLVSCFPLYLVVRPGTGVPSLHFFLNLQLVAASVALTLMCPIVITGLLLSPNLLIDGEEIAHGRGQDTALYATYCAKMEARRDTLLMQLELDSITGEYSGRNYGGSIFDGTIFDSQEEEAKRRDEMIRHAWQLAQKERQLPADTRDRIHDLRISIIQNIPRHYPDSSRMISEYPYFIYTYIGAQVFVPITSMLNYILIWKVFVSTRHGKRRKIAAGIRVLLAILASMAFFLWIVSAITKQSFQTSFGLAEDTEMLREQAQNFAWCELDPKGLW